MDMSMRRVTREPGHRPAVEVTVKGEVDATAVRGLAVLAECALEQRPRHLVIDLAECLFLDDSAVALLVDTHHRASRAGGLLTLRCPPPQVRGILETARVDQVLHITPAPTEPPLGAGIIAERAA